MGSTAQRQISFIASFLFSSLLTYLLIQSLTPLKNTVTPELYLNRCALAFLGYSLCIVGAWFSVGVMGGLAFSLLATVLVFFVTSVTKTQGYLWFVMEYGLLCLLLYRMDQEYVEKISLAGAEREKAQIEKNDLTVSYKMKGEAISALFEKYSTYYNMRKLAEELAGTLVVAEISQIVVNRCVNFILRGDVAMISLFEPDQKQLPVIAFKEYGSPETKGRHKHYETDLFDHWAIKNHKQLIVMDTHQDFRFDAKDALRLEHIRSLILVPLIQGERILGTLRIHSSRPNTFTNDELRLLDTIAVLASSALSNALLFEQTQELAIKDSLTGLYVRRFFFERLKEEHRRALTLKHPLSLLMCDLDHFKRCNDRYGHAVGDLILIQFAKILEAFSEGAVISRYGGEEFSILLPNINRKAAIQIAEKIRQKMENSPLDIRRETVRVTVSIGVANLPEDTQDMESLIEAADKALYEAKKAGRNRVC